MPIVLTVLGISLLIVLHELGHFVVARLSSMRVLRFRKVFAEKPAEFDPRKYLGPSRDALQQVIEGKMKDFGQAGHNDDYEPLTLEDMKKAYAAG